MYPNMSDRLIQISSDFYNLRGTLKVLGLNVGTQMSLARLSSGDFVLLDSYAPDEGIKTQIEGLTDGGKKIKAILNLHPFHTLHVRAVAQWLPHAKLYGTSRHKAKFPELAWQELRTEDPQMNELFGPDLKFSVPRGVDFVPSNPNLHFASVLAFHHSSNTLHVDDTLTWSHLPILKGLQFHPSLSQVLQRRASAVDEFSSWLDELIERCRSVEHLCTAHLSPLPPGRAEGVLIHQLVEMARNKVEKKLQKHRSRFG